MHSALALLAWVVGLGAGGVVDPYRAGHAPALLFRAATRRTNVGPMLSIKRIAICYLLSECVSRKVWGSSIKDQGLIPAIFLDFLSEIHFLSPIGRNLKANDFKGNKVKKNEFGGFVSRSSGMCVLHP